jgi:acetoin utilization deacetylase AcuC-like enzyme
MSTLLVTHPACLAHDTGSHHPERPARLEAVLRALGAEEFSVLERCEAPEAEVEQIARVHPESFVKAVIEAMPKSGHTAFDADTICSPGSKEAVLRACGAVVAAVDAVASGEVSNAFCAVRPPGHHAEAMQPMGFCIFNNVAVGALHARAAHGHRRVAVMDFDVHHGNGTQDIFWNDPDVLFLSTHQWPLYPGTGHFKEIGGEQAKGSTINIPMPPGAGDANYLHAWDEVIEPAFRAFKPDFLLISAGYDAYEFDPLGSMKISRAGFSEMAKRAFAMMNHKRTVAFLEGGYNTSALGTLVSDVLLTWLGDAPHNEALSNQQNPDAKRVVQSTKEIHHGYW